MNMRKYAFIALLVMPLSALATWTVSDGSKGPEVRNGSIDAPSTVTIPAENMKQARKLVKKLNKLEDNDKGVKDDGDCPDMPGVVC